MFLCLDVGNTQIFGGVISNNKLILQFRHNSGGNVTSDQLGVFFKAVLRENNIDHTKIKKIAICSVVPHLDRTVRSACIKYFSAEPFMLKPGIKTGLKIKYKNPLEVGADRIANAIAATSQFPNKNLLIVDLGTATTICAISKNKDYLGGAIFPGMKVSMNALQSNTAKLPAIEIVKPSSVYGKTTTESLQIGLYYSQLATIKELCKQIKQKYFLDDAIIIGTGGFSKLFKDENLFNIIENNLVLHGLMVAYDLNKQSTKNNVVEAVDV